MRSIVFLGGYVCLDLVSSCLVLMPIMKSIKVKESTTFSRKYCTELTSLSTLSVFEVEVWCYRGAEDTPKWILRNKGIFPDYVALLYATINTFAEDFSTLCFVKADLSPLSGSAQPKSGRGGKTYWTIVFSIEIHFGLTEFKARIKWNDNVGLIFLTSSIILNNHFLWFIRAKLNSMCIYP